MSATPPCAHPAQFRVTDSTGESCSRCEQWIGAVGLTPTPVERENERLRAAVLEGDRRIAALMERIHPTIDGYCPACGGSCLIGFATPTPARDAVQP